MKLKYYNMLVGVLLMTSCEKSLPEVDTPDFDVTTKSTVYKVGDKVTFDITGEAHIVSFYSGEPLKEFAYKDGRIVDATNAGAKLSFTSAVVGGSQGTLSTTTPPQLKVMASTNFSGNYDISSVQAATWTDITSRFSYSISPTVFATSTVVDISDLLDVATGKPIYIAYKYITEPQATKGIARNWQIQSFLVQSKKDIGIGTSINPTITDQGSAAFRIISNPLSPASRSSITSTRISLLANVYDAVNEPLIDPSSENWAISKPINSNVIDLGPDRSLALKDHAKSTALTQHTHTYTQAGTYKAVFVASNANISESKEVVKEIVITVAP